MHFNHSEVTHIEKRMLVIVVNPFLLTAFSEIGAVQLEPCFNCEYSSKKSKS